MAADTSIITNADVAAAEFAAAERVDNAPALPSMSALMDVRCIVPAEHRRAPKTGRPRDVLAWIDRQERMRLHDAGAEGLELIGRCRAAAGMTGSAHGHDDRADVAAELCARHLGTLPSMSKLCGDALNLYRKITRHKADLKAGKITEAAEQAATPTGLGVDREQQAERFILARMAAEQAADETTRVVRKLGLKGAAVQDSMVWTAMYRWMRPGRTDADMAAERGTTLAAFQRSAERGAAIVRAAYSGPALLSALGLGSDVGAAEHGRTRPTEATVPWTRETLPVAPVTLSATLADACTLIGGDDWSREAHSHTPLLADCGRAVPEPGDVAASKMIGPVVRPVERTADVRRAAYRQTRALYRERMLSVGQGAALAAEQDRAPKRQTDKSTLGVALGRVAA